MGNPTTIPNAGDFAKLINFLCPRGTNQVVQVLAYVEHDGPDDMILHQCLYRDDLGSVDVKIEAPNEVIVQAFDQYNAAAARKFWDKTMADMDEIMGLEPWTPEAKVTEPTAQETTTAPTTQDEAPAEAFSEDTVSPPDTVPVPDKPHVQVFVGQDDSLNTIMVPADIHETLVAEGLVVGDDPDNQTLAPGVDPADIHELIATWPGGGEAHITATEPEPADQDLIL